MAPLLPTADGSWTISASKLFFVLTGIKSAAIGAVVSWILYNYAGWRLVSYSILAVFGFWTLRAIVQGLFVPGLLTLTFSPSAISGPCLWWFFRERIALGEVDWKSSGVFAGRLIVYGSNGRRIYTRLAWYGPDSAGDITSLWKEYANRNSWRIQEAT